MKSLFNKTSIIIVSIFIPLAVILLYLVPGLNIDQHEWIKELPKFNASLNAITTIVLLAGLWAALSKRIFTHRILMLTAVLISIVFLISYIIYHGATEPTIYGGKGLLKIIYYYFLITHIVLAIAVVPFVLLSLYQAFNANFLKHRKIARWTFPIWLYVTTTGVIVYLMLAPYY